MKLDNILTLLGGVFNQKNVCTFNTGLQDFSTSMDSITKELGNDEVKYKENASKREAINKKNLEKIWGKNHQ